MADGVAVDPDMRGKVQDRCGERALAALAGRQHGVVSRAQLLRLGFRSGAVDRRVAAGRLHPVRRGVYSVGHARLTRHGAWMAAVLGAGPAAVLSHRAAGALWAIVRSDRLEVTVGPGARGRRGLTIHRSSLPADERTVHDDIPTTTVARTLLDLAAVLPPDRLAKAVHEAEFQRLGDDRSLADLLARHPRRPGAQALRAILADRALGSRHTRSELEDRFVAFVARHDLPPPLHNQLIEGHECDAVWPKQRVIVELDGHASHATTKAFEHDRARDRQLLAADWRVVRVTWRHLHDDGRRLATDLRRLLC